MKIHGLQKLTLLDFHQKVACTVFLGGCDFRCPFCHNFELVDGTLKPVMEEEELLSFLESRKGLLDGVCFTGGEPCLHAELPALLEKVRALGYAIKLDTNGCHPELLEQILDRGLADYVAMDVKNCPEKYARTCGVDQVDLDVIRRSIALIMEKAPDYEFRTTVVAELHQAEDFHGVGEMVRGASRYFIQSFVDRDTVPFAGLHAPSRQDLEEFLRIARIYVPQAELRGVD